jgi:hypothetical protein
LPDESGIYHQQSRPKQMLSFLSGDAADHVYRQAITLQVRLYGALDAERYLAAKSSFRKNRQKKSHLHIRWTFI